jgi:WD40 repeat protein/serine/threonine protein kinase
MTVEEILQGAVEKTTPAERAAYLDAACGQDQDLRARIVGLLQAHEGAGSFLEEPLFKPLPTVDEPAGPEHPGMVIGPYKLMEQIGEGGMGLVFVAEQQHPVRRKVALKVIKPGMDSRAVIARFEAERQALALMDHPNIARVFDGGETALGRPYFVMELVKGSPITDYCDEHRLTPRQRLELFTHVCQTVQHAHQKGIIHRDLKPSNVMVVSHDGTPVVKVIDFGVAKAIGQHLTDKTIYTQFAQLIGTPLYMSPEQAGLSGLDADTRTDIYALGVLLYELLTGATPFDKDRLHKASYEDMRRIIREEEPPKPSTRISTLGRAASTASARRQTDPKRLRRLLRGELDWIVMKCLEKDRNRRYDAASGLARDLERYLCDEPVQACPPSIWYRVRKFARRHKVAVAIGSVITVALALLLVGSAVSATLVWLANQDLNSALAERDETLERERYTSYLQRIALAQQAWATNNLRRAEELLDGCRPETGKTDLRCWEWHYLKRLRGGGGAFMPHKAALQYVDISPLGDCLAACDTRGGITFWDARTYEQLGSIPHAHSHTAFSVVFSPDGQRVASAGGDGAVRIWDVRSRAALDRWTADARSVLFAKFSPDGHRLAFLDSNARLYLWEPATGKPPISFQAHPSGSEGDQLVFSPDGQRLASAVIDDSDVKIWDVATGALLERHRGPGENLAGVAFSPDGRLLAVGSGLHGHRENGVVRIWDTQSGQELHTLRGHVEMTGSLAFSPDGRRLASTSLDQTIKIWDVQTGLEVLTLTGHKSAVWSGVFAADGRLFTAGEDGIRVWDGRPWREEEQGQEFLTLEGHRDGVTSVAFRPTGGLLATADCAGVVKLWPAWRKGVGSPVGEKGSGVLKAGQGSGQPLRTPDPFSPVTLLRTLQVSNKEVHRVAFSPDGKVLATVGAPAMVKLWEASTGREICKLPSFLDESNFMTVAFSPDGRHLAASGWISDHRTRIWNLQTKEVIQLPPHDLGINALAFNPNDGRLLVTAGEDGSVRVWDWSAGKELRQLQPAEGSRVRSLAFSPDGKLLATGGWERIVHIWDSTGRDPKDWKQIQQLPDSTGSPESIAFGPDGRHLAWGGTDSTVKVWDLVSKETRTLHGHASWVRSVEFSPDGRYIASGGQDGSVKIWETPGVKVVSSEW